MRTGLVTLFLGFMGESMGKLKSIEKL